MRIIFDDYDDALEFKNMQDHPNDFVTRVISGDHGKKYAIEPRKKSSDATMTLHFKRTDVIEVLRA